MIKSFIKENSKYSSLDGFYHTKYDGKWKVLSEEKFIENIHRLQLKIIEKTEDEFSVLDILSNRSKKTYDIISPHIMGNSVYESLLFFHWFERRYGDCVIDKNVLYTLNVNIISGWYNNISKEKIGLRVLEELEGLFRSERFSNYTVYHEYFYDFFPDIGKFTFNEFRSKTFLNYLLELFPESKFIDYKCKKRLWRFTDVELREMGEYGAFNSFTGKMIHNPIKYNNLSLPCFMPNFLGEKNYERYNVGDENYHTTLELQRNFLLRDLENLLRTENGLPKVGEGWISETILFEKIKERFPNEIVVQHGSPNWLGLQHLDVYFPKMNMAIEYQGVQHQRPVEFFGGEQAFLRTQERDKRKKDLCDANNCSLFYVFPEDDIDEFINELYDYIKGHYPVKCVNLK